MPTAFLDYPGPLAFAHRGGAAHAPENSWRAFEHAVGLGYGYLETDAQATADGVLVAFHDRTLDRVTGQPGRVSRLTLADLASARIGGTEPIPVLEDLLGTWPDVRFNIDVKDAPAIVPLAGVLRRTNAWDRVCVVSFSATRLRATRRVLDRPVCMAASPLGTAVVRFGGPRSVRDTRGPHRYRFLDTRPGTAGPGTPGPGSSAMGARRPPTAGERPPGPLAERLARAGVRCVQVPAPVTTRPFIARAHALGLQVHVWTVNDRPTMESLLDLGVDGIMTDETVALRDVLTGRGQWHPRTVG
ncbi:MAG TPA: glycerophosphodiester phosphodiesterase family protein [Streptosporangiaceae bacterium]|nr:glycerophosphodiester phosphodiesterase family protein [Streptosporangiaceae bacterium]